MGWNPSIPLCITVFYQMSLPATKAPLSKMIISRELAEIDAYTPKKSRDVRAVFQTFDVGGNSMLLGSPTWH